MWRDFPPTNYIYVPLDLFLPFELLLFDHLNTTDINLLKPIDYVRHQQV